MEKIAGLDGQNKQGYSALRHAAGRGKRDCVRVLASGGADLHLQNTITGSTALTMACQEGHSEAAVILIEGGASMSQHNYRGYCPIHRAALLDRAEVVRALLGLGCDPDMVSTCTCSNTVWGKVSQNMPSTYLPFYSFVLYK